MKYINPKKLEVGDIFAKEIKLHGMEAFKVIENDPVKNYIIVRSRLTGEDKKMSTIGLNNVVYLRHE